MQFDPDATAAVVIDMQNGFCHPDGSLYAPDSEAAIDPVRAVIKLAREAGAQVISTTARGGRTSTYDAFYRTGLEGFLDTHGIRDLLICGTLANVCVLHTAGSAGLRDFRPVVIEDSVGSIEDHHREYALEHADWLFGEVRSIESIEFV